MKNTINFFMCLFLTGILSAQQSGIVSSEDGPLPGATVLIKGTSTGTSTDFDGNFTIEVNLGDVLVISFVGFTIQEVTVSGQDQINVTLAIEEALEEVVVTGYGTQRRRDVTGSIATIETTQINSRPIASVEDAMQGLVPGLNIAQRASSPGELGTVTIRGLGSITAGTQPLWVVDGFPTDQRNAQSINPDDVENIAILKDASSTAIYGSRGANGVILITTKTGKQEDSKLTLTVTNGTASVPSGSRHEVLNSEEYVQFHKEKNGGTIPAFIADNWDGRTDTDWQDLIFREGTFKNYALSASGGSGKVSYLVSGNYVDQEGVIIGEGQNKYSARAKLSFRASDKVTLKLNLAPNYTTLRRNSVGADDSDWASLYAQSLLLAPILPVRRADGTFSMNSDLPGNLPVGNPLETFQNYNVNQSFFSLLAGMHINIEIIDGLNFNSSFSGNLGNNRNETYYSPTVGQGGIIAMSSVSTYNIGQTQSSDWLNENLLNYKKEVGDHSFDVLGGYTLQKKITESVSANTKQLKVPNVLNVNIGNPDTRSGSNSKVESSLVSYLGRLNYGFKDKYLLTATVRTDGSSVFGRIKDTKPLDRLLWDGDFLKNPFFKDKVSMEN